MCSSDLLRQGRSVTPTFRVSPDCASEETFTSSMNRTLGSSVASTSRRNPMGIPSAKGWSRKRSHILAASRSAAEETSSSEKNTFFRGPSPVHPPAVDAQVHGHGALPPAPPDVVHQTGENSLQQASPQKGIRDDAEVLDRPQPSLIGVREGQGGGDRWGEEIRPAADARGPVLSHRADERDGAREAIVTGGTRGVPVEG